MERYITSSKLLYMAAGLLLGVVATATVTWYIAKEKIVALSYESLCPLDYDAAQNKEEINKKNDVYFVGCGGFF